jgi:hypothetical protein
MEFMNKGGMGSNLYYYYNNKFYSYLGNMPQKEFEELWKLEKSVL